MIVKNKLVAGALALSLFATPIVAVQAASTSDTSEALAECLYKHATASDKQVLVQWAYVTLSKTSAAKQIQTIPSAKVKNIEAMCMLDIANRIITPAVIKYSKVVADEIIASRMPLNCFIRITRLILQAAKVRKKFSFPVNKC